MGRAVEGPVPPADPDEVWKRGSRERRIRRLAQVAPIVVIVGLVIGLVAVASGDDEAAPVFADLTAEDQAVVDEYLAVLEERGVLGEFPDERAAVEYAWRVECFGDIDDALLYELNAATIDAVSTLSMEAIVSAGWRLGLASDAELAEVRATTDEAMAVFEDATGQLPTDDRDAEEAEVLDVATVRLEALPTVRQAIDDEVHPTLVAAAEGMRETAEDLLQVDQAWSTRAGGDVYLQLAGIRDYALHQLAATRAAVVLLEMLDSPEDPMDFGSFQAYLEEEDERLQSFIEWATPQQKSMQRNEGGPELRTYDEVIVAVLDWGQDGFGAPPLVTSDAYPAAADALQVRATVAGLLAEDLRAVTTDRTPVDEAVAAACDATGDQILAIGPAAVGGVAVTLPGSSAPPRPPSTPPDTMIATLPE